MEVAPLIHGGEFDGLLRSSAPSESTGKAFDANWILEELNDRGAKIVISRPFLIDRDIYKWRHLIESFFGKLKEFKRIAMRSDKTDTSFAAVINSR